MPTRDLIRKFEEIFKNISSSYDRFNEILDFLHVEETPSKIPKPAIKYLAIQGGGAKGAAYVGAMKTLDEKGYLDQIEICAGASAGAITSFIVGLGFDAKQFKHISDNMNFLDFNDLKKEGWGAYLGGYKPGIGMDLVQYGAAFTGESFHDWASFMVEQILGDPNATFKDLHEKTKSDPTLKKMIFKATRYNGLANENLEQTFSYEETPEVRIADAVRASMAFPGAFAPWVVKDKQGKAFGIFADGGILNNYPIDVFNNQLYYDSAYKPVQKKDPLGGIHQINPCSIGLSLTPLEELDEKITPFTERLKKIHANQIKKNKPPLMASDEIEKLRKEWSYFDMFNAVWWNKIGVAIKEQVDEKQKLYDEQTIQIYPEEVGTLEFAVSKDKLSRIEASGSNAMKLWLEKYRKPNESYAHGFDSNNKKQKNHPDFYLERLYDDIIEFQKEIKILKKQHATDDEVKTNIKLHYYKEKIKSSISKIHKKSPHNANVLIKKVFKDATEFLNARKSLIKQQRNNRWKIIETSQLVKDIIPKLTQSSPAVVRVLRGHMSKVFDLIKTDAGNGHNLLGLIVKTGDPILFEQTIKVLYEWNLQCRYQGRQKESVEDLLNNHCVPGFFDVLNVNSPKMLEIALQYGVRPFVLNKNTKKTGLQSVILNDNFEAFSALLAFGHTKGEEIASYKIEGQPLLHYIMNNASLMFIEKLAAKNELMRALINNERDGFGNSIFECTAMACKSASDPRWKIINSYEPNMHFGIVKKSAEQNYNTSVKLFKNAMQEFAALTLSNVNDKINQLDPSTCMRMLLLTPDNIPNFHILAEQPENFAIFKKIFEKAKEKYAAFFENEYINKKISSKNILYRAVETNNIEMVKYLKANYHLKIDNAGPPDSSSALIVAAKNGNSAMVIELSEANNVVEDSEQKTALHYLAMNGSVQAFCAVLFNGTNKTMDVLSLMDKEGKSILTHLIENKREDILKEILSRSQGVIYNWYFDDIFGWKRTERNKVYEQIAFARQISPQIYDLLTNNVRDGDFIRNIKLEVEISEIKKKIDNEVETSKKLDEVFKSQLKAFLSRKIDVPEPSVSPVLRAKSLEYAYKNPQKVTDTSSQSNDAKNKIRPSQ